MSVRLSWLPLVALLACLSFASSAPAAVLTAYGVDSALGGTMDFTQFTVDYNNGMVMLTAKNLSATRTYQGVGLPLEFFYPADASGNPTANGLNYVGGGVWRNAGPTQELDVLGVNPPFTSIQQPLNPALINVPLNDSIGSFNASVMSTDSVPLIQLGDFGPGVSKSFTVLFSEPIGGNPPFHFVSDAFFVAVPEPSAILLAGLGVAMLGFRIRRKLRK